MISSVSKLWFCEYGNGSFVDGTCYNESCHQIKCNIITRLDALSFYLNTRLRWVILIFIEYCKKKSYILKEQSVWSV